MTVSRKSSRASPDIMKITRLRSLKAGRKTAGISGVSRPMAETTPRHPTASAR